MNRKAIALLKRLYRSDRFGSYRLKRRFKELIYQRGGFLFGDTESYRLYRQHSGRPIPGQGPSQPEAAWKRDQFIAESEERFNVFLRSGGRLNFGTQSTEVVCSLVVILHNKAPLTYRCLEALAHQLLPGIELVIVDNASSDRTGDLLGRLDGRVTILRNEDNLHFLLACNQAFERISPQAEAVALINNDAVVDPLALVNALACLRRFPDAGAVAGKVLHLDGRLQEAGQVIFNDGSSRGVGRDGDPTHPLFNVRRPVDYGSGCLLMVRSRCLKELGGFDPRFAPAYYEETDLCLRLWQRGWPVLYEPRCVAHHVEFASSGGSLAAVEDLIVANCRRFRAKHARSLVQHPSPHGFNTLDPRSLLGHLPVTSRVLWIDDASPVGSRGSGFTRTQEILTSMADQGFWLSVFTTFDDHGPAERLQNSDYELIGGGREDLVRLLESRAGFYSHVCASRHHNIRLLADLITSGRATGCPPGATGGGPGEGPLYLADVESLFSIREHSRQHVREQGHILKANPREVPGLEREIAVLQGFDRIITVSEEERRRVAELTGKPCWTMGHSLMPHPALAPFDATWGILFLGAIQDVTSPNFDSVEWLERAILPAFYALPEATQVPVTIAGFHRPDLVADLYRKLQKRFPQVRCVGFQSDLSALMLRHRLFIAPTRFAAGLPHKVHQAVAHGLPVVLTPLIADQMGWREDEEALVAPIAADFARAMARLHGDQGLWERLREAGQRRLRQECDPRILAASIRNAFAPAEG